LKVRLIESSWAGVKPALNSGGALQSELRLITRDYGMSTFKLQVETYVLNSAPVCKVDTVIGLYYEVISAWSY
jgi:hypothetical protein